MKTSPKFWKNALLIGLAILGAISSIATIADVSLYDICDETSWLERLGIILALYASIVLIALICKWARLLFGITLYVRGIKVQIRRTDIFSAKGWKLINFNEFFDTQVDDVVIARSSLNGQLIMKLEESGELSELLAAIADQSLSPLKPIEDENGRLSYPLGCIKRFKTYMILAFTRFNKDNEAYFPNWTEYERCLRTMWREIGRVHAGNPVFLPLLGGGMTRFNDRAEKPSPQDLLKCMICTLRTSNVQLNGTVTILLTRKVMRNINLYDLKGVE